MFSTVDGHHAAHAQGGLSFSYGGRTSHADDRQDAKVISLTEDYGIE
jgi:hypothetical protein